MNKSEYAMERFLNGCNCSQAVFTSYCTELGIEEKLGLKLACPFGGGMGHSGEVCGAVSGALLAIGLKYGQDSVDDKQAKADNYRIANDFINRFKKLNGSVNCTQLIGYDLSDDSELEAAKQTDAFKVKCSKYVGDAVKLLEEVIAEQDKELNCISV